jgi:predicted GIY-YIG superfamily endonuclease
MDDINHIPPTDPLPSTNILTPTNDTNEPIEHPGPNEPIVTNDTNEPIEHPGPNEPIEPMNLMEQMGPNEPMNLMEQMGPNEPMNSTVPAILFEHIDIINNTLVCYCIRNEKKTKTYVGATNHFCRRIRQHNREIVGGAKATGGHKWHKIILVHGFNTRHDLLSFEWHFKHVVTVNKSGIKRRVEALTKLLSIDRWKMLKFAVIEELQHLFVV